VPLAGSNEAAYAKPLQAKSSQFLENERIESPHDYNASRHSFQFGLAEGKGFESFHDSKRAVFLGRLGQALASLGFDPLLAAMQGRPGGGKHLPNTIKSALSLIGGGGGIRARRGRQGDEVPATNGSPPTDRVNGRRFSRPLRAFQARQNQTKRDQRRPIAAGLLGKGRFVWFCPYWSGLGSSVYQIRTTGWSSFWVGLDDACTTVQRRPASRTAISTAGLPGGPGPWPSPLQRPLHP